MVISKGAENQFLQITQDLQNMKLPSEVKEKNTDEFGDIANETISMP